ncbi:MAG: penicillin-binding protein 1A [Hyphomonadaceae bacterium]
MNLKTILIGTAGVVGVLFLGLVIWFFIVTQNLPSEDELANYEPPIMSRVHAGDGKLVAEFATQHRVYVPSEELPDQLVQAFISAEDKTFFEHSGIDLWGMFRGTVLNALQGKRMTGGSTITQQVVKNMLVGDERSIDRKVREAVLAMRIEKKLSKEQILELYMNEIYLGGRSYGVGAAALNYFGKSLGQLTLAECAMLAGLPQAPGKVNPYTNPEAAVERRNYVIERMVANGYVSKADGDKALAEPLKVVNRLDTDENQAAAYYVEELRKEILALGEQKKLGGIESREDAQKAFYEGGLSIRSTLDSNMQLIAQTALRAGLETYDRRHGWRGPVGALQSNEEFEQSLKDFANNKENRPKIAGAGNMWQLALVRSVGKDGVRLGLLSGDTGSLSADDVKWAATFKRQGGGSGLKSGDVIFVAREPAPDVATQMITDYAVPKKPAANSPWRLRQVPQLQGALIAMDPHTGRVYAMAGGYSFEASQFNRAMQAKRQPGSSFKPFVYAAAMEIADPATGQYKWTPSYRVLDTPYVSCDPNQEKCYKPTNYSEQFYGLTTLRVGVEKSRNAMTVRLASEIGFDKVSSMGKRMGIYDELPPYESMALGAGDTTVMRMATAYAEIVNGGKQVRPVMFDRIQNRYGETVYRTDQRACQGCATEWKAGMQPPALPDERQQVIDPVTAYQVVSILEGVVQRGTATSVRVVGKPIAAKTGTTNDQFDAWTMGFTPDLVVGVWVGFDQPRNMGEGESGGRVAAPIFRDFMLAALKDRPAVTFRIPDGVELVEVDADSGCQPGPETRLIITEAFKPGSAPTDRCSVPVGSDGYRVDYSKMGAGDESVTSTRDGQVIPQPGADAVTTSNPVDPTQPQQPVDPNKPKDELTLEDGTF